MFARPTPLPELPRKPTPVSADFDVQVARRCGGPARRSTAAGRPLDSVLDRVFDKVITIIGGNA